MVTALNNLIGKSILSPEGEVRAGCKYITYRAIQYLFANGAVQRRLKFLNDAPLPILMRSGLQKIRHLRELEPHQTSTSELLPGLAIIMRWVFLVFSKAGIRVVLF